MVPVSSEVRRKAARSSGLAVPENWPATTERRACGGVMSNANINKKRVVPVG
ncbi:hypothetical protein ZHAS_00015747 [Anopheles sinensis]|uniref:Uncharacterized protein n=1 Tax=Anopheles sinensis TaxID=74873 RepID=A0A084WBN5_ANOSI|nr:hypothetical protein ZHAS_00015747 [Anopheles sinensis]